MRVMEAAADLRLAFVALKYTDVADQIIVGKLEYYFLLVQYVLGKVDVIHAAMPKHTNDLIVVDPRTA